MEHKITILSLEEYNKHKDQDRFIHEIAFAHGVEGWEEDRKALCYYVAGVGTDFRVSPELQQKAKEDYNQRKQEIVKSINNKLVFVGMGMDFTPSTPDHIGNHRIRTYIKNNVGILCFVEFGATGKNQNNLRCDHALIDTRKNTSEWGGLGERDKTEKRVSELDSTCGDYEPYTKENVLKLVNKYFDCSFKEMEVYSNCLDTEDYTSISEVKA